MWCPRCDHEVEALPPWADGEPAQCSRCGAAVHADPATQPEPRDDSPPRSRLEDPYWDGWRLEQELDDVEQLIATWRIDDAHESWRAATPGVPRHESEQPPVSEHPAEDAHHRAAWGLILTGLGAASTAVVLAFSAWLSNAAPAWASIAVCVCLGHALMLTGAMLHLHANQERMRRLERESRQLRRVVARMQPPARHEQPRARRRPSGW